jgi:hypothetical protein
MGEGMIVEQSQESVKEDLLEERKQYSNHELKELQMALYIDSVNASSPFPKGYWESIIKMAIEKGEREYREFLG